MIFFFVFLGALTSEGAPHRSHKEVHFSYNLSDKNIVGFFSGDTVVQSAASALSSGGGVEIPYGALPYVGEQHHMACEQQKKKESVAGKSQHHFRED